MPENYILTEEPDVAVTPFNGFAVRCPHYEADLDTIMVSAHVEYSQTGADTLAVQVWAVITNTCFRWFVTEFGATLPPDTEETPRTTENIISALIRHLNESEEFDRGMRRAVDQFKAMLNRLAL